MRILGISAFYHDSAAALVEDGRIVAAAQEERFTRKKHDARFPRNAIAYCLDEAGVKLADIDHVVFYDKPFLKFERLLETYLAFAPRGFRSFRMAMPLWLKEKLFQKSLLHGRAESSSTTDFDWRQAAVHRASSEPRGIGLLSLAVRGGGRADHGRRRRMGDDVGRRSAQATRLEMFQEIHFPAFARPALFGLHLLHRLQGQLRRVQGDGARALRRAEIRAS